MQTKLLSTLETAAQVIVGYIASIALQVVAFPLFGIEATIQTNLQLGVLFAVTMFIKGYGVRRAFNWITIRANKRIVMAEDKCQDVSPYVSRRAQVLKDISQ